MLRVIIMLDCNICGQPFEGVVTTSEPEPLSWKGLSQDLEDDAERSGWSFYRSAHHCSSCITDVAFSLRQAVDEAREAKKTS
jgi:hypothetical protein